MKKQKSKTPPHFRVDTVALLNEIVEYSLPRNSGILKVPLNTFKDLLKKVADRAAELDDPILNKLMFDLTLYELPTTATKEYGILMRKVYSAAEKQIKKEKNEKRKL